MTLEPADLEALAELAIAAAMEAGEMIARSRPGEILRKPDGPSLAAQVLTEVDRRSEQIVLEHLGPTLAPFELGLLTEERPDDGSRLNAEHFWCIDPLDGTLPFVEGRPGYAVSIALVSRDGTPLIGVVHDPAEGRLVHAIRGAGALRDGTPWRDGTGGRERVLSVFADRSLLQADHGGAAVAAFEELARDMGLDGVELHATAGAVMNAVGVLDNPPACYVKDPKPAGGGSLWDFAATASVAGEVGAIVTDIRGAPLDLNRADSTSMGHRGVLFATDEALARRIRASRAAGAAGCPHST